MAQKRKGSVSAETFDEFLAEQGILEATEDHAVKELIAEQIAAAMEQQGLTKVEMAARMKTSRRQLDRLFDPAIPSVTLDTLRRAANAVGRSLRIELVRGLYLDFQDENMKKSGASQGQSASELISKRIAELGDWRGETLKRMRKLIKEADPDVVEEWKWMGTPVWSHDGIICTGESYKSVVKLTFAKGASLKDPARLFNSSLDGNARRAIDIHEGEVVDESAFKALVREAVALNSSGKSKPSKTAKS